MSWDESGRLDKDDHEDGSVIINGDNSVPNGDVTTVEDGNILKKNEKRKFDPECYDDRPFYSMLLKVK